MGASGGRRGGPGRCQTDRMPQLTEPTTDVHASFLEAMEEFAVEGRGRPEDGSNIARDMRRFGAHWHEPDAFAGYVRHVREMVTEETAASVGSVPTSTFWYVDGTTYLGRIAVRHRLDDFLFERGGHIGYDVRPTARRRGHATAMLRAVLPRARALGLESVLVTCDEDNTASRRVITSCGGKLEDQRGEKLRYWIGLTYGPAV